MTCTAGFAEIFLRPGPVHGPGGAAGYGKAWLAEGHIGGVLYLSYQLCHLRAADGPAHALLPEPAAPGYFWPPPPCWRLAPAPDGQPQRPAVRRHSPDPVLRVPDAQRRRQPAATIACWRRPPGIGHPALGPAPAGVRAPQPRRRDIQDSNSDRLQFLVGRRTISCVTRCSASACAAFPQRRRIHRRGGTAWCSITTVWLRVMGSMEAQWASWPMAACSTRIALLRQGAGALRPGS